MPELTRRHLDRITTDGSIVVVGDVLSTIIGGGVRGRTRVVEEAALTLTAGRRRHGITCCPAGCFRAEARLDEKERMVARSSVGPGR